MSELAQQSLSRYGAVHVLCNNAGVGTDVRPSWNTSLHDWNWVLGVNLMGLIHEIRTFTPMIRNERFYVLTHPEWQPLIEHRMQTVLGEGNHTTLQPPGAESLIRALAEFAGEPGGDTR